MRNLAPALSGGLVVAAALGLLLPAGCGGTAQPAVRRGSIGSPAECLRLADSLPGAERRVEDGSDFGGIAWASAAYHEVSPHTPEGVAEVVRRAAAAGCPVRTRGRSHSMNGHSLPRDGEIVIRTRRLDGYRFVSDGVLRVGAGAPVLAVDAMLRARGLALPVVNDGGTAGPSVGGFVAAGGIGAGSVEHGGFWEQVRALHVVDGTGRLRRVTPADAEFRWHFGAMGQLGVVVEADLAVIRRPGSGFPLGEQGRIDGTAVLQGTANDLDGGRGLYWFTLFGPAGAEDAMARLLADVTARHPAALDYLPPYRYPIRFRTFHPPLVTPHRGDLVALGLWGRVGEGTTAESILALERDFDSAVRARPELTRYFQSEVIHFPYDFHTYFGKRTWKRFRRWKERLDPGGLLNRGDLPFGGAGGGASAGSVR